MATANHQHHHCTAVCWMRSTSQQTGSAELATAKVWSDNSLYAYIHCSAADARVAVYGNTPHPARATAAQRGQHAAAAVGRHVHQQVQGEPERWSRYQSAAAEHQGVWCMGFLNCLEARVCCFRLPACTPTPEPNQVLICSRVCICESARTGCQRLSLIPGKAQIAAQQVQPAHPNNTTQRARCASPHNIPGTASENATPFPWTLAHFHTPRCLALHKRATTGCWQPAAT